MSFSWSCAEPDWKGMEAFAAISAIELGVAKITTRPGTSPSPSLSTASWRAKIARWIRHNLLVVNGRIIFTTVSQVCLCSFTSEDCKAEHNGQEWRNPHFLTHYCVSGNLKFELQKVLGIKKMWIGFLQRFIWKSSMLTTTRYSCCLKRKIDTSILTFRIQVHAFFRTSSEVARGFLRRKKISRSCRMKIQCVRNKDMDALILLLAALTRRSFMKCQ